MSKTKWASIDGYDGKYEVSNTGLIRRTRGSDVVDGVPVLASLVNHPAGYMRFHLPRIGNAPQKTLVHRIVAEYFVPNPNRFDTVHHKDGREGNNHAENLEWIDHVDHRKLHAAQSPAAKRRSIVVELLAKKAISNTQACLLMGVSRQAISKLKKKNKLT